MNCQTKAKTDQSTMAARGKAVRKKGHLLSAIGVIKGWYF
jgi:hypothetical protein